MRFCGNAHVFGDNIDTDAIIPARYLAVSDPANLAQHCMEDINSEFTLNTMPGDIIVGGWNFGCGSSREHAPIAIKGCGISCVIASSFARIFFRNSINIGLPILECPEAVKAIHDGDKVEVDLDTGIILCQRSGDRFQSPAFPDEIKRIIQAGGLLKSVRLEGINGL